jgi:modulator of FtsH protease HflK
MDPEISVATERLQTQRFQKHMARGDYQTFRRASLICVVGLIVQIFVALLMLIYSTYSGDHAARSASILFGSGVIVWAILLFVYDQHRRERIEAMEAEQFASAGGASASAFSDAGDDLRVAARRLVFIQKWVVPAAGVIFAGINILTGLSRLRSWDTFSSSETFIYNTNIVGAMLAIGLAIGVVGFIFARFVSGMGKINVWSNLRAGAAQSVAISMVGVLLAVAAFLELSLGQMGFKALTPIIIPIGMIVLGCEVVLNLILDVYRPRKPGEDPRPAFDSRLLGLLAAPDRIAANIGEAVNYQFGVDVTGTWLYQLLSKLVFWLVGMGVAIAWLMTTLVVVEPHERGLILTNGRVSSPIFSFGEQGESDIGPGLHVKLPWPFATYETPVSYSRSGGQQEEVRTTTGVRVLQLASNAPDEGKNTPLIWTESHSTREKLNIVQPSSAGNESEDSTAATSRANLSLVALEVPMHFVVRDVKLFDQFAGPGQREDLLQMIGRRVVTQYLGQQSIDDVLAHNRTTMLSDLRTLLEEAYAPLNEGQGPGIEILFVGMQGAHPPLKVAPSYERVIAARQNRESMIEEASRVEISTLTEIAGSVELAEQIVTELEGLDVLRRQNADRTTVSETELEVQRLLETAGGEAGEKLLDAGAQRWTRHMSERGQALLLLGQQQAYEASPSLYRSQSYFNALLDAIENARVYLTPADLESLHVRIDLMDQEAGTDVFDPEAGEALAGD